MKKHINFANPSKIALGKIAIIDDIEETFFDDHVLDDELANALYQIPERHLFTVVRLMHAYKKFNDENAKL